MTSTGRHVSTVTEAHVSRLRTLLSTPGVVTQVVRKLGDADRTFSMLDIALRRGAPVPECWAVSAQATGDVHELEHADELYDAMSETLPDNIRTEDEHAPVFGKVSTVVAIRAHTQAIGRSRSVVPPSAHVRVPVHYSHLAASPVS